MANALIGSVNNIRLPGTTMYAYFEEPSLPVANLQTDQGDASTAWQTLAGATTSAALTVTTSSANTWRAFILARTNLTTAATVRWRVGPQESVLEQAPTFDMIFTAGSITTPAGYSFTRASKGWEFNSAGTLTEYANDVLRFAYDPVSLVCLGARREESRTNSTRNPRAEGATPGTPGTPPTNWVVSTNNGLSSQIVGTGTETGIPYADIRIFGTVSGATSSPVVSCETTTGIVAATAQTWTSSYFLRLVAGSFNGNGINLGIDEYTAAGAYLTGGSLGTTATNAGLASQRVSGTRTLVNASTTRVYPYLTWTYVNGNVVDFTVRIGAPQIERGANASSPMLPTVASPAAFTRSADVCLVTGLNVDPGVGYSVFCDIISDSGSGGATVVPWSLSPTGAAFADSHYVAWTASSVALTLLDSVHGNAPSSPAKTFSWGTSPAAVAVSVGSFGGRLQVNALSASTVTSWAATSNGPLTRLGVGGASWSGGGGGASTGVSLMRRFTLHANAALTLGQLLALSTTWSTVDTSALAYDSGVVAAGVVAGYGQSVTVAPADVAGSCCRVDIVDTTNPDGFLNIPLAYAGPVWQPTYNVSPGTTQGRDDSTSEFRSRGGQEYPTLFYQARRAELDFVGITNAEVWPKVDALDQAARAGGNILYVPDPSSSDKGRGTILGRFKARTDLSYTAGGPSRRSWRATITERL